MSIQASEVHYSTPRGNTGPWTAYSVLVFDKAEPLFKAYRETPGLVDGDGAYAYVPLDLVEVAIASHGGVVDGPAPTPRKRRSIGRRKSPKKNPSAKAVINKYLRGL